MSYTDAFTGTELSPPAGWTANTGTNFTYTPKRYGGKFTGPGGGGSSAAHYSASPFADDHYSKATIGGVGASSLHYVLVRAAASGATFYYLRCAGGTTIGLRKVVTGTVTTLGSDQAVSYANGDVFELRIVGNTLTGYRNGVAIPSVTATDASSPLTSGSAGLGTTDQNYTWDDWEGGDVVPPPTGRVYPTMAVALELSAGVWTDVTADLVVVDGVRIRYGIQGNSPTDRVASTGTCEFTLDNGTTNSAHTLGYYSPNHPDCRDGFQFGTGVRVQLVYGVTTYTKFLGKLATIAPIPGQHRERQTRCLAVDWMDEAAAMDIRDVVPQENKTADELVTAVLAAMPATSQPTATALDAGTDTFPYTMDKLGGGTVRALTLLNEIVQSDLGYLHVEGGTLVYRNRSARTTATSRLTLDNTMVDLRVPSTLDNVYNRVRATIHPRTIDSGAVVLCTLSGAPSVGPGATVTFWLDYKDPNNDAVYIGGKDFVTPAATTDYLAFANADGTGTNYTANQTVTATGFASSVKFEITNGAAATVYLTKLQFRGKGVYDLAPVTYETSRTQSYGERRLDIDLPYQNDAGVAEAWADYVADTYQWPAHATERVTFPANEEAAWLTAALALEPGDRITLSEAVTGLASAEVFIQSVSLDITHGPRIVCAWGLAPALADQYWILDDPTYSKLDATTRLAYV